MSRSYPGKGRREGESEVEGRKCYLDRRTIICKGSVAERGHDELPRES